MQNLSPRHVKTEESLRLGVVSGWYSTKVSGTFVSGPHDSEADLPAPDRRNQSAAGEGQARCSPMTLERGSIKGFEHDRMVMLFSMMNGGAEVSCAISSSAMDDLERGVKAKPDQRDAQFLRLRDRIEQCASRKFEAREFEGTPPGIILRSLDFRN